MRLRLTTLYATIALAASCAPRPATQPQPATPQPTDEPRPIPATILNALPPIPAREGAVAIDIVYPGENEALAVRDSTFVFGSVGTGSAQLTINGAAIDVAPNGAFLAFLPVPADGVYHASATAPGGAPVTLDRRVRVPAASAAPGDKARIIASSISPRGAWVAQSGERIDVSFRATPGARAFIVLPDSTRYPLVETGVVEDPNAALSNFSNSASRLTSQNVRGSAEYRGFFSARPLLSADTTVARPVAAEIAEQRGAVIELIAGRDTVRTPLPLNLAVIAADRPRVGVATERDAADPDRRGFAVARPGTSGPYHYLWPWGTEMTITGERGSLYRAQLTSDLGVWIAKGDVRLLPAGAPPPTARIGNVRFFPGDISIDVRFASSRRLPFYVTEGERSLTIDIFGATSTANYMQYGALDPLIERAVWSQPRDNVFRLEVDLTRKVWGYQVVHADNGDLILRIRRPPRIDPQAPLRGLTIVLDPGHPPEGAIGPTRLTEAEANLRNALALQPLLVQAGAKVIMTRTDNTAVPLNARPLLAVRENADILLSMHNNAFPDGVNPFENNGTSVYYYQPHSVDLAQEMQAELLREFGLRNLGIGRADLALVRATWMPSVLTETMFLMVPQQEAALRNPDVNARIARAHLRALERFARERATP